MLDDRKQKILAAVIEDYVTTAEPVGSRRLVERYRFNVSPATIRHELAVLEDMGYLIKPHPSAGRIPSNLGYRYYVDRLIYTKSLSYQERETINDQFSLFNREIEQLMRQTSFLLSRITSYASLVFAPALKIDRLKRLDLVLLGPRSVLLVAITSAGSVVKKTVSLDKDYDSLGIGKYEAALNELLVGLTADEIRKVDFTGVPVSDLETLLIFKNNLVELLTQEDGERFYHDGTANLLSQPEFESLKRVQKLLSILERNYGLLQLLSEISQQYSLVVRIGDENGSLNIDGCSLVAASYRVEGESQGALGILGPTRMDYPRAIAAVQYVADNLSNLLESIHKRR